MHEGRSKGTLGSLGSLQACRGVVLESPSSTEPSTVARNGWKGGGRRYECAFDRGIMAGTKWLHATPSRPTRTNPGIQAWSLPFTSPWPLCLCKKPGRRSTSGTRVCMCVSARGKEKTAVSVLDPFLSFWLTLTFSLHHTVTPRLQRPYRSVYLPPEGTTFRQACTPSGGLAQHRRARTAHHDRL